MYIVLPPLLLYVCTIPYAKPKAGKDETAGPSVVGQNSELVKRGNLCAEPERHNSAVSNSQVTSFAHWRAWKLLPTPYRSPFPEGADESEETISSPSPLCRNSGRQVGKNLH
jgi:hypothetical protein